MPKSVLYSILCIISVGFGGLVGCSLDSSSETDTQIGESFSSQREALEAQSTAPVAEPQQSAAAPQDQARPASQDQAAAQPSAAKSAPAASGPSSGGFLWKPVSEGDGNLVVLLPSQYRGRVSQTAVLNASGQVIEVGRFAGDTHNGNRPHYRFSMPGAGFGSKVTVAARMSDGSVKTWRIPNGGSRYEA